MKEIVHEIEPAKKPKKKRRFILVACLAVFLVYAVATLVSQQIQINQKQSELTELEDKIEIQEIKNDDAKELYNSEETDELYRQKARESGYAEPDERVFINVAGE